MHDYRRSSANRAIYNPLEIQESHLWVLIATQYRESTPLDARRIVGRSCPADTNKAVAQNLACVRKFTLNLARMEQQWQPKRVSLKNIRNLAAWDIDVRQSILRLA
ncbi:MAG: hypothetical protein VB142_09970 [Burkholderia sp.]